MTHWRWTRWWNGQRLHWHWRMAIHVGGQSRWFVLGRSRRGCGALAWGRSAAGRVVENVACRCGGCRLIAFCCVGEENPVFGRGTVQRKHVCERNDFDFVRWCHRILIVHENSEHRLAVHQWKLWCCIHLRRLRYVIDRGPSLHLGAL